MEIVFAQPSSGSFIGDWSDQSTPAWLNKHIQLLLDQPVVQHAEPILRLAALLQSQTYRQRAIDHFFKKITLTVFLEFRHPEKTYDLINSNFK